MGLITFLSFISTHKGYCQLKGHTASPILIKGLVKDSLTGRPLSLVNVQVKDRAIGVPTNQEGKFSLRLDEEVATDSLQFSLLGYLSKTFSIQQLASRANQTILLTQQTTQLASVEVQAKSIEAIVKEVGRRLKHTFPTSAYEFEGYYRHAYREMGRYVKQQESAFYGFDQRFLQLSGYSIINLKQRQSKDYRRFRWRQLEGNLPWHYYWRIKKQPSYFFTPRARHNYHYQLEEVTMHLGEEVYKISITLKDSTRRNNQAWAYVRVKDYALLEVGGTTRIQNPESFSVNDTLKLAYTGGNILVKFASHQGQIYPAYSISRYEHQVYNTRQEPLGSCDLEEELVIHQLKAKSEYPSKKAFQNAMAATVAGLSPDSTFWATYNKPPTTAFSRAIAQDLFTLGDSTFTQITSEQTLNEQLGSVQEDQSAKGLKDEYAIHTLFDTASLQQDFTLLRNSLEEAHPALYRYTPKTVLSRAFDSTYRLLTEPLTQLAFYQLVTPLLAKIRCGHTQASLSNNYQQYLLNHAGCLPVKVRCTGKQLYLLTGPDSVSSLLTGSEILTINGKTTQEIIEKISARLPADGYITTRKEQLLGENFALLYYTYIEQSDHFVMVVKTSLEQTLAVTLPAIPFTNYKTWQQTQNKGQNQYQVLAPKTALLRVTTFSDDGQLFKDWVAESFTLISKQSITHLIIDLRDNEGGRDDYALFLLGYLMKKPFHYHSYLRAATTQFSFLSYTWQGESFNQLMAGVVKKDTAGRFMLQANHPTLGLHQPNATTFQGKVYFLINGNTFSAAADFSALAQTHRLGIFIGQESGGAARGNTSNGELLLTLPHSAIQVSIPLFEVTNAVHDSLPVGRGVIPQYITSIGKQSDCKRDAELELVLQLIAR